jgi:Domain of unknown function (DUF6285)
MPLSLSPAPDMLATIRAYLEGEILPSLEGEKWFNLRVSLNMLAMVERELRLAPAANEAERGRLAALLGSEGTLETLNRMLVAAIRERKIAADDPRLHDHLRQTTADALRINNPQWLANDEPATRPSARQS